MGLLQLVLLNGKCGMAIFWVQLSLAFQRGSVYQQISGSSQNQWFFMQDSFKDLHLPHPNSHCTPSPHTWNARLRRYAMPWVFASVVSTRPPHRCWHYPSELRGQQSRPDDMGLWCWQLANVCCQSETCNIWNISFGLRFEKFLKVVKTHQWYKSRKHMNVSMSKLGASIEHKRSTLHHLAYSSSIQLLYPVSHHIIPNHRSLRMSLDQASRWPNSFFAKAFLGHHLTVMKGIE